ncbi:SDR family oxidoreductase [Myxococcota bacterium]|nr:SDR family oxidoreductase [Myxococcota bacterium]
MPDATQPLDPLRAFRLDGRVAVVTGASSGLGRRFAQVLHAVGARIALVARRRDRLETLAQELDGALILDIDLSEPGAPSAVIEQSVAHFDRVDILVNNAGISHVEGALDEDPSVFRRVIELNLSAPYELAQAFGRNVIGREANGTVVNIASMLGLVAARSIPQASYTASKGGLIQLTRDLANQWARKGVRVNALAPGWFHTEMTGETMFEIESGQRYLERHTPMGRGGREDELDGALLYLCSEASSFTTGSVLVVDGGWTAV